MEYPANAIPPNNFERILLLMNTHSTRSRRTVEQVQDDLDASIYAGHYQPFETVGTHEETAERLKLELRRGDALCVIGGDGTVNTACNVLINPQIAAYNIPMAVAPAGNGNDFAKAFRNNRQHHLVDILAQGTPTPVHPIMCHYSNGEEYNNRAAASHLGFGATALGAQYLNDSAYRRFMSHLPTATRLPIEGYKLTKALKEAQPFTIKDPETEGAHQIYERSVINGPRMAKLGHLPVALTEQRAVVTTLEQKSLLRTALWMGAVIGGMIKREYIDQENPLEFTVLSDNALMHFDAETQSVKPNTTFYITPSKTPFYVLEMPDQSDDKPLSRLRMTAKKR